MNKYEKKGFYDRIYKFLILIPIILLISSLFYLYNFEQKNGDIINKDVSLTGGTAITIFDEDINIDVLKEDLKENFPDLVIRGISDIRTGRQTGVIIETKASPEEIKPELESLLGYDLTSINSSIEFSGASLSEGFYKQLRFTIIIAFVLMSLVIFVIFRTFVPSLAVILSAFADIVMTIALVDILGIKVSSAGLVAFLMLIGYSVDTDVMLTSRLIKNRIGSVNKRLYDAFKTGMTMTLTSIAALTVALIIIYSFSDVLKQIFSVLIIGLVFDIINTWLANAVILKMYAEAKQ